MKLPDLHKLKIFVAVGSGLSFRAAAENLGIAQPAVSRAVKALEDEMGLQLLDRTTRRVSLTQPGEVLFKHAQDAFGRIQLGARLAEQTASGNAGNLLIGYSALAAHGPMVEMIYQYNTLRPSVVTGLRVLTSLEQVDALNDGSIDCGILLSVACRDPSSHFVLLKERMVALISRADDLANRSELRLADLADTPFVFGALKRWTTFRSVVDNICLQAGFLPSVIEEPDDVPVLLRCISMRKGVTLYGASITETLPPNIVAIPIVDPHAFFEISIAWQRDNQGPILHSFLTFAREFAERARTQALPMRQQLIDQ